MNVKLKEIYALHFLILFSFSFSVLSQDEIKGQVLEIDRNTPVVFATIQLKQSKNGFITDENGYFRLPKLYKHIGDTLIISSIGYVSKEIPVVTLDNKELNSIFLKPWTESLDEVTVIGDKKKKPKWVYGVSLVKKAIAMIPTNCPTTAHSYVGYYRDYQLVHNEYLNINEAIVEVFDAGINTHKLNDKYNQTALYQYQANSDFPRDDVMTNVYESDVKYIQNFNISAMGGNELSILNIHDPIRNHDQFSFSFIDVFQKNFIGNHEFNVKKIIYLNDIPLYEIDFKDVKKSRPTRYSAIGKIYIARTNFAIHRIEYKVYDQHKDRPLYSLKLEYASKGDYMYLNYISFNNLFQIRDKKKFKVKSLTLDKNENAIILAFTNPVNKTVIDNVKNFKFLYNRKKLSVSTISFSKPDILKISLVPGTISNIRTLDDSDIQNITYRLKNITDIGNRKLDKKSTININQFRELFVQEVFPVKLLPLDIIFLKKNKPLSDATLNNLSNKDKYWVNTPLKKYKE